MQGFRACLVLLMTAAAVAVPFGSGAFADTDPGYTLHGEFTITVVQDPLNGMPDTDAFDHLIGLPVTLDVACDSLLEESRNFYAGEYELTRWLGPAALALTGDTTGFLQETVSPLFGSTALQILFVRDTFLNQTTVSFFITSPAAEEMFSLELSSVPVIVPLDTDGYPDPGDFEVPNAVVTLRRHTWPSFTMTDYAQGDFSFSFRKNAPVSARRVTMGRLKTLFRL